MPRLDKDRIYAQIFRPTWNEQFAEDMKAFKKKKSKQPQAVKERRLKDDTIIHVYTEQVIVDDYDEVMMHPVKITWVNQFCSDCHFPTHICNCADG